MKRFRKSIRHPEQFHKKACRHRQHVGLELDLHGYRVEDALRALEKEIYSGRHKSILAIHGRGTGALKRAVREYLAKNSGAVKEIQYGEEANLPGGDGVTLLYL